MCWFKPKPPIVLVLPHPEEKPDYSRTLENTSIQEVLTEWCNSYQIPLEFRQYWFDAIIVFLDITIPYPAGTWEQDGRRYMKVRPEWLNPGVIAHEQAHNSYALLSGEQKIYFEADYESSQDDPLIKLLHSQNTYMDSLTPEGYHVEGHAEIYRYIGGKMPPILKQYYPKLF
jgi:hypothetical protein